MDLQKTGLFLKQLRKEKGLTQEQLGERFSVSSRTVSRWETGSNMPDVSILIELADFYGVEVREILDGEREQDPAAKCPDDTLKKVAAYATEGEKRNQSYVVNTALVVSIALFLCTVLFADGTPGLLYGLVPGDICGLILTLVYGSAFGLLVAYLRVRWFLEKPSTEAEKTVMATVASKEVRRGTGESGRSVMGYSFIINFRTADNNTLELYAYEVEYGRLREGMRGTLTYRGRYFINFSENIS